MRKRLLSFLLIIILTVTMLTSFTACSKKEKSGDFTFELMENGNYALTGFKTVKSSLEIIVPDEYNGKSVTKIADFSFSNEEVITKLTIGKNITEIGDWAFTKCKGLKSFEVSEDNECFTAIKGVLFSKDKKILISYPQKNNLKEIKNVKGDIVYELRYSVPEGTERIGNKAFYNAYNLIEITFPSTLKEIGDMAFLRCSRLKAVSFPDGLERIEKDAFLYCEEIKILEIPGSVKYLGEYAFYYVYGIEEIVMLHTAEQKTGLTECENWSPCVKGKIEKIPVKWINIA